MNPDDQRSTRFFALRRVIASVALPLLATASASAAGVTLLTHGFNSNVDDWVIPTLQRVPAYSSFRGTTSTTYELSITRNGSGQFIAAATRIAGLAPTTNDSGEILVALDWSTLSGLSGASSTNVANAAVTALLSPTFIPELGGRALVELPLHFAGHSRGSSVITEMARFLGAQGVWVDHLTTLDPRPVTSLGDPSAVNIWSNVLFADNYWQNLGDGLFVPNGQSLSGSYNRKLTSLNGGYSSSHSDVHLWYHGTVDFTTPLTVDGASITTTERGAWWTALEATGTATGLRFSLIGRGNRLSTAEPAGAGNGRISDGFNKRWDLGAGTGSNRTALPTNTGLWPNLIRIALTDADPVSAGSSFTAALYHQSGSTTSGNIDIRLSLDNDFNPFDGTGIDIDQRTLPNTGTLAVSQNNLTVTVDPATVAPGLYAVCARITDGARIRYLYASEQIEITPSALQPAIDSSTLLRSGSTMQFTVLGYPGQNVTIRASSDCVQWDPIATHTFTGTTWQFTDPTAGNYTKRFYKAELSP